MSKGLSKAQATVLRLLSGKERGQVYANCASGLTTAEIMDELIERDLVNRESPRKHAMFTVRRACISLLKRKLIEGEYCFDERGAKTITWRPVPAK